VLANQLKVIPFHKLKLVVKFDLREDIRRIIYLVLQSSEKEIYFRKLKNKWFF